MSPTVIVSLQLTLGLVALARIARYYLLDQLPSGDVLAAASRADQQADQNLARGLA